MRADGKRVKNVDPMYTLAPYFMRHRYDAQNMIKVTVPYEPIHDYVIEARKNGHRISHMSVVLAAFIRTISEFPRAEPFCGQQQDLREKRAFGRHGRSSPRGCRPINEQNVLRPLRYCFHRKRQGGKIHR